MTRLIRSTSAKTILPKPSAIRAATSIRRRAEKLPQDTIQGCHERAAADLLEAASIIGTNQRLLLERSSQSWTLRATLLAQMETNFENSREQDRFSERDEPVHVRC